MKTIGIDLGSRTSKIVLFDANQFSIIGSLVTNTGVNPKETANFLYEKILKDFQLTQRDIGAIFSTGYGRNIVPFSDKKISEISCHAKGVHYFFPNAKTVIDIGGQDSKAMILGKNGKVLDFVMNDKCAAGTGRFLEVAANLLELTVDELAEKEKNADNLTKISNICVVFAESEMIGLIAKGEKPANIIRAVHHSIATRMKSMIMKLQWKDEVVFTGGVALNSGMRLALEEVLQTKIFSPKKPSITGALGAAVFAGESL